MIMPKQNSQLIVLALPIILALASLGCGLSSVLAGSGSQTEFAPTRTPMPTFTPTAEGAAFVEVAPVNTEPQVQPSAEVAQPESVIPTPTPAPPTPAEPTATPTPDSVMVTVLQNMNVRSGPGTNYPVVGAGKVGDSSKVIGRNDDGTWLKVEFPSADGSGWVFAELVQVSGDAQGVEIAQAPPPPPHTATPWPTAPPPPPEPEKPKYQFTPTGWHASGNKAIVHFKGRIKDEQGNLVNGYSVLVDNWSWGVLSHPTGASNHYPEKGDGEWDVVIPEKNLGGGVGWWYLTVVRYDCPDFFARFDAQCKQFTRLSEDVKIMVNWPDETIINADWICHWDCDKGLYKDAYRRP
jgi:hypothetical protein